MNSIKNSRRDSTHRGGKEFSKAKAVPKNSVRALERSLLNYCLKLDQSCFSHENRADEWRCIFKPQIVY